MSRINTPKGIAIASMLTAALTAIPTKAEIDFGALDSLSNGSPTSPVPKGLVLGGVVLGGKARYAAQDNSHYVIPGGIYFGDRLMYLGDRARYYVYKEGDLAAYLYGRVRFGNLDPTETPAFVGMQKRKWQLEGGVGANLVTPYALITVRASSDLTGTSKGQEALFWADFPIVKDNWLIMPGAGVMVRSENMANYYFGGVSSSEATATRPAWNTGTTVSPMAALIASYRFNKDWIGMAAVNYEFYASGIKNSPLVQHNGEFYAGLGLGYLW
ncbi:MipA/OmpV family protein [Chitinibacter fontanus]|uniref:MipA/OmpV family protein n=1 Tax=Chitinibacter fontanus TaxID=1737446 RepID=A0A7D5ZH76_9NEIS|nr:MipA/OmpV family protein [Chitinibacter fontanus]QLI82328.1 MipA/OmpV family protein [Chitinibacter fontanus]